MYIVIVIIINFEEDINRSFLELRLDLKSPELELELKSPEWIELVMDTGRFLNILNYKFQQISCQGAVGGLQ